MVNGTRITTCKARVRPAPLLLLPSSPRHIQVPTEEFFMKDMGLPLEMTPNYDDFSCQVSYYVFGCYLVFTMMYVLAMRYIRRNNGGSSL